jgi:hypothetical protein
MKCQLLVRLSAEKVLKAVVGVGIYVSVSIHNMYPRIIDCSLQRYKEKRNWQKKLRIYNYNSER